MFVTEGRSSKMKRAQASEYAKAQSRTGVKSPRPLDPRTIAMNMCKKARLANASVAAKSSILLTNPDVRSNALSIGAKADILAIAASKPITPPDKVQRTIAETAAPGAANKDADKPEILATELEAQETTNSIITKEESAQADMPSLHGGTSPIQRKALAILLKGTSIIDTASICGVDEWTLRAWLETPEVDRLYSTGRQQNIDSLVATIQAAAVKAAATLVRLSESDNPSIQTRAAKALVQLAKTTNAAAQKALVQADVAKARLEDLTVEFNQVKTSLGVSAKNWEKIRTSLVHGTFRRPGWLPRESWARIINAKYDISVAW